MSRTNGFIQKLIEITNAEYEAYQEITEGDEPLRSRIDQYCREIGIDPPADIADFPWSATFVSWCLKTAGATRDEFKFDPTHAVFVKAAIANADANTGVFRAYPIGTTAPRKGDLIHRNRSGGTITYEQARNRADYPSHSAIVIEVGEDRHGRYAITVGGNESDSIRRTRVALAANGKVAQNPSNPFIGVIQDLKDEIKPETSVAMTAEVWETPRSTEGSPVCEGAGEPDVDATTASAVGKPTVNRAESTTHQSSRDGTKIDYIVIHYTTSRNIEGSISHFKSGTPRTSAHYIVGRDGELVQMVPDEKRAWHAGSSAMNARSIGIEHVAAPGDRITSEQGRTSVALISWLMQEYEVPLANVIPHVCVKPTSCCGDLFADFGGGAGLSCERQKSALHAWLAANGVGADSMSETPIPAPPSARSKADSSAATAPERRLAMAQTIINYEARRDARGRLQVYKLDPEDGGGRYEVAGINERYHKQLCDELVALIEAGQYAEAERRAVAFIADYTEGAAGWTSNPGVEFYLRDSMFNRGARGAAWILQEAVGAPIDQVVGPQTLAAVAREETRPSALLQNLRRAREAYERLKRDESSRYWRGLVNRWNNALAAAKSFLTSEGPRDQSVSSTNAGETSAPVFEPPPSNTEAGQPPSSPTGAPGEFQPPAVGERREDPAIAAPAVLATASAVDSGLIQMHRELEGHLFARPGASAFAAESAGPPDMKDLIVGVGIGPAHRDFESVGGAGPGAPVLNVYVAEPMQMDAVKAVLVDSFGVRPLASDDRPVNVIHTGPIDALGHRHPERPSPCGISVAHFKVTAGTQGALARGRSGPRQNRLLLLSNNHVLANANDCQAGDAILQPGWADFPFNLANQIAALEQWVPINYNAGGANFVDCATGWCWPDRVRKEFIYPRAGAWAYFSVDPQPVEAHLGLIVGKSGRTTQLTSGQVIDVNASLRVNYGAGRIANFRDQISIRGSSGSLFGRGGDSGSLIWTWHEKRSPIGLLFAGGGEFTFANKITHVLAALDIALFT